MPPPDRPYVVPDLLPQAFTDLTTIIPKRRRRAHELIARFASEDLTRRSNLDKSYVGINWWATRRAKIGFGWGRTWLDRFDKIGVMDCFQTCSRWIYGSSKARSGRRKNHRFVPSPKGSSGMGKPQANVLV
ncbi:MAG: hypothetical protein JNM99_15740 [Verrucomicrobiaceae bacterium]|nr:hypothetical protein [Verrucomicrobiaceae bacterium]